MSTSSEYWAYPKPAPPPGFARTSRRRSARRARGVGPPSADERRAARRDAERRARLELDRRADGTANDRSGQDVLGRVRGGRSETNSRMPETFAAVRNRSPRARAVRARHRVDLQSLAWHLDEPLADLSSLGFLALSELAARHVTVALSGQGADELLGWLPEASAASRCSLGARVPGFAGGAGIAAGPRGPARFRRLSRTLSAPDSVERLIAMSGRLDEDCVGRCSEARSRASTDRPRVGSWPIGSEASRIRRSR